MRGRSSTEARAPHGLTLVAAAAGTAAVVLASLALSGCRLESPDIRQAKETAKDFAAALRSHDAERLRALASCVVATDGIQDARFRYLESPQTVRPAGLDSLIHLYADAQRLADSAYAAAPDSAADLEARFERARSLARRVAATRAARRAAGASRDGEAPAEDARLQSVRAHVLVRFAGEAVGPSRIERDTIVRLLRAPGGTWIVYAFDLSSDAPGPLPY